MENKKLAKPKVYAHKPAFEAASRAFGAAPGPDTMLLLTTVAKLIMSSDSIVRFSKDWRLPATGVEFDCVRLTTDRRLSEAEVAEVTAALGYANATYIGMEEMVPTRVVHGVTYSILEYDTDSRDRRRTAPDYAEAFEKAAKFVENGSPVRKTNRAGVGTEGTRLCSGIGKIGLKIEVYPAQ